MGRQCGISVARCATLPRVTRKTKHPRTPPKRLGNCWRQVVSRRDQFRSCRRVSPHLADWQKASLSSPWSLEDVDDVEGLIASVVDGYLRRRGAYLRPDLREDLDAYLLARTWEPLPPLRSEQSDHGAAP